MFSFPHNAKITGYSTEGLPEFDRSIDARDYRKLNSLFYTNGVIKGGTSFQVVANTGMTVLVKPGAANINGCIALETVNRELTIQAASGLDRIDRVVLRLDEQARTIDLYVLKGTPASVPVAPNLTRPEEFEGDVYELGIADVFVAKNSVSITQERITDTRLNKSLCGIVAGAIHDLETTNYYNQLTQMITNAQSYIQNAIDGTLAGNLENKINKLNPKSWQNVTLSLGEIQSDLTYSKYPFVATLTATKLVGLTCTDKDFISSFGLHPSVEFEGAIKGMTANNTIKLYFSEKPTVALKFDIAINKVVV
ncbi:hypothetical protein EII25_03315 [Erysipelotrichaceae bacterium OH741_COT-311]|nr:hypothetical protein EII25_03315 [Erysipelotrichaceae bacterium OH741_COT-311]